MGNFINIIIKTHLNYDWVSVLAKQRTGRYLEHATSKQTYPEVLIFVSLYLKVFLLCDKLQIAGLVCIQCLGSLNK